MRVYVASAFGNKAAVRAAQARARELGFEITHDWTAWNDVGLRGTDRDAYRARAASYDLDGVAVCDVFLLLLAPVMAGTLVELGMALALGKSVWLVGGAPPLPGEREPVGPDVIFYLLPQVRRAADAETALLMEELERRPRRE